MSEVNSRVIRALFSVDGSPIGFYPSDVWPSEYPDASVIIGEAQYIEFMENQGARRFINGEVVEYVPLASTPTVTDYESAIQALIEETARSRQFRDAATMASYTSSTVQQWSSQALSFVAWRDAVWMYAYAELEKVTTGTRPQPTVSEILDELPKIVWPEE